MSISSFADFAVPLATVAMTSSRSTIRFGRTNLKDIVGGSKKEAVALIQNKAHQL
jgi:hypothetical protein